jgi:rod shape-determining protein MreC
VANFFGNKRLIALLVGLILLIIVMGATVKERPFPTLPERFTRDSVSFMQGVFYRPTNAVAGFIDNIKHIYRVYDENKQLKANLDQSAKVEAERNQLVYQNAQLRAMLDIKQNKLKDYGVRAAEVIARSPDRWNHLLTISKGSNDGIKPNMAVTSPEGYLIGRVRSVSNFSSQVELVMDVENGNHISAVINGQGQAPIYGVIESYDFDQQKNWLIMRKIPPLVNIKKGDYVSSSGMGGVMPAGLMIGQVAGVTKGDYGLTQTAYVTPLANFYQLETVFVVERSFIVNDTPPKQVPANTGSKK